MSTVPITAYRVETDCVFCRSLVVTSRVRMVADTIKEIDTDRHAVTSIVYIANGISFALQAVLFLISKYFSSVFPNSI